MLRVRLCKFLVGPLARVVGSSSIGTHAQEVAHAGLGEATFQRICAVCHASLLDGASPPPAGGSNQPAARALPREMLRQLSAEAVLAALTMGKMQAQGAALSEPERRAVAEYASGNSFGAATYGVAATARPARCPAPAAAAAWTATARSLRMECFT
jgi:mono/diheme cytochrome c family protein